MTDELLPQEKTCLNCGENYRLQFCNACGQKTPHRYTVMHVVEETFHSITHADRGIFALMRDLMLRPGRVALDLVEGRRKRHFNLFQYLILITGVITFLVAKSGLMEEVISMSSNPKASGKVLHFQQQVGYFTTKYANLFYFLLLPLTSFCAWLLARSKRFNYAENVVMIIASTAASATASILPLLFHLFVYRLPASMYLALVMVLNLFFYAMGFRGFHQFRWGKSILLSFGTQILFFVFETILVILIAVIYLILTR